MRNRAGGSESRGAAVHRPAGRPLREDVVLRPVSGLEEYEACIELQKETWGQRFHDIVPASLLVVSQKIGALLAGAFDPAGRMLGFAYSLAGTLDGQPVHWSHMLAVTREARGAGLGRALKLFQREWVLAAGVDTILWTYDPLVARNAHLNLNRLGATVSDFVPNLYGSDTGSPLHGSDETDRFVVRWELAAERTLRAIEGGFAGPPPEAPAAPAVELRPEPAGTGAPATEAAATDAETARPILRIEVPADFEALLRDSPTEARRWRLSTREAFRRHLDLGFEVEGLYRDEGSGRCFYWLTRKDV